MTSSGLATRPRPSPPRAPRPGGRAAPPPAPPPERHRASFERVLAWSILLSVALHLLFLLLSRFVITVGVPPGAPGSEGAAAPRAFGMEAIEVIVSADAPDLPARDTETEEALVPVPATRPSQPAPSGAAAEGEAAPADAPRGSTTREALQPGYRDSRLYVNPPVLPDLDRTEHERYMEHLEARIDAVNDSMGVAAARERRTSDWTVTDGSGNRWGLSPDGLHLGDITIPRAILPLPGATGDNQTLEAERERQRMRDEIQRQEEATERGRTQRERTEAIRQREEAQRTGTP